MKLNPRNAYVHQLEVLSYNYPQVSFRLTTGEGFMFVSFCRDVGKKLGTGAYMGELVRERSGAFTIAEAVSLAQISFRAVRSFFYAA